MCVLFFLTMNNRKVYLKILFLNKVHLTPPLSPPKNKHKTKPKKQKQKQKKPHKTKNSNDTWVLITILMFNINLPVYCINFKVIKKKKNRTCWGSIAP